MDSCNDSRIDFDLYSTNYGAICVNCFKPIDAPKYDGTCGFWIPDIDHLEPEGLLITTNSSDYGDSVPDWVINWLILEFWESAISPHNNYCNDFFLATKYYNWCDFIVIKSTETCDDFPEGTIINYGNLYHKKIDREDWC